MTKTYTDEEIRIIYDKMFKEVKEILMTQNYNGWVMYGDDLIMDESFISCLSDFSCQFDQNGIVNSVRRLRDGVLLEECDLDTFNRNIRKIPGSISSELFKDLLPVWNNASAVERVEKIEEAYRLKIYGEDKTKENIAKPEIKEVVVEKKEKNKKDTNKEFIPSKSNIIKLKDRIRKNSFINNRRSLHKWLNYRIDQAVNSGNISYTKGKKNIYILKTPGSLIDHVDNLELNDMIALEDKLKKELKEASSKMLLYEKTEGKTKKLIIRI